MLMGPVQACECVEVTQRVAFEGVAAVFYGKLMEILHLVPDRSGKADDPVEYTFRINETWKGPRGPIIKVRGIQQQSMCAMYSLKQGNSYLLYVFAPPSPTGELPEPKYFIMGLCLARGVLDDDQIARERKLLGRGFIPAGTENTK